MSKNKLTVPQQTLKIGTLVRYKCMLTDIEVIGHVTDMIEDNCGYWMFEIISLSPFDRGWYPLHVLEVLNESRE